MAENKKSFVLYADLIHMVKKLPKDKAGELFLTILQYVNDENPSVTDPLVDIAFEPIKHQMKRDLKKYESIKQQRSEYGRQGGLAKASKSQANLAKANVSLANVAVNDTVNVNDTVTVINNNLQRFKSTQTDQENVYRFAKAIGKVSTVAQVLNHADKHDAGLVLSKPNANYADWLKWFRFYFENMKEGQAITKTFYKNYIPPTS
jgi:hypothetical protein